MAKKRLNIRDKQGNVVDFDISSASVTIDAEGKSLDVKLTELLAAISQAAKTGYSRPDGGIPASDLAGDIPASKLAGDIPKSKLSGGLQESLNKADTALQTETDPNVPAWAKASNPPAQVRSDWNQTNANDASFIRNKPEIPSRTSQLQNDSGFITAAQVPEGADLSGLFASVSYDSTLKRIYFYDKGNNQVAWLDASPFVLDGMVSNVSLSNGVLTITFNTDSGKQPIEVSLGDVFDTDDYYTKTVADTKFVEKVSGKGLSSEDFTTAEKTKLQNLPDNATLSSTYATKSQLNGKQDALTFDNVPTSGSNNPVKSGGIKNYVDNKVANATQGETVVTSLDNVAIIDGFNSNTTLAAATARSVKILKDNIVALYGMLANIAFTNGKNGVATDFDWIGTFPTHTITVGTLNDVTLYYDNTAKAAGATITANEGEVVLKLTPAQNTMILASGISITKNGSSVPFRTAAGTGSDEGSTFVSFVLSGDTTVSVAASQGIGVQLSGTNSANVQRNPSGVPLTGDNRTIVLSHAEHYHWDGNTITLSINNVPLTVTTDYTIADNQDGTKTITILKTFEDDTYPIVITVGAVEDDHVVLDLSALDATNGKTVAKIGNTELSNNGKVYNGNAAQVVTIELTDSAYKFSAAPTYQIGSGSATNATAGSDGVYGSYSFEIGTSVANGTTIAISATTELKGTVTVGFVSEPSGFTVAFQDSNGTALPTESVVDNVATIPEHSGIKVVFTPTSGLPIAITDVTMGNESMSSGYTFANDVLTIESVVANVVINANAALKILKDWAWTGSGSTPNFTTYLKQSGASGFSMSTGYAFAATDLIKVPYDSTRPHIGLVPGCSGDASLLFFEKTSQGTFVCREFYTLTSTNVNGEGSKFRSWSMSSSLSTAYSQGRVYVRAVLRYSGDSLTTSPKFGVYAGKKSMDKQQLSTCANDSSYGISPIFVPGDATSAITNYVFVDSPNDLNLEGITGVVNASQS